jgi:hypothetical protein
MLYEALVLFIMSVSPPLFGHETVRESLRVTTLNWSLEETQPILARTTRKTKQNDYPDGYASAQQAARNRPMR